MQQLEQYLFVRLQVLLVHQLELQVQKIIEYNKKKKKKHDKILAKSKLNSIETLISQAL